MSLTSFLQRDGAAVSSAVLAYVSSKQNGGVVGVGGQPVSLVTVNNPQLRTTLRDPNITVATPPWVWGAGVVLIIGGLAFLYWRR